MFLLLFQGDYGFGIIILVIMLGWFLPGMITAFFARRWDNMLGQWSAQMGLIYPVFWILWVFNRLDLIGGPKDRKNNIW